MICVERVHVLDGGVQMVLVKSGFFSGVFCSSLNDYNGASIVLKAWCTEI